MNDALDDIRYVADSEHRVVVLEALTAGPCTRDDLRAATGASAATVGRLVAGFEERGWLRREGRQYRLTTLGAFVAESFDRLHRDVRVARELRDLLPGMPLDEIGVGIDRLADARVTRVTPETPLTIASRIRELELTSQDARSLTDFFPEPCIDGRYEAIVEGTQTFEAVFSPGVVDEAMASATAEKFAAIVAADRTDVRVYEGPYVHRVMVHDGVACLVVRDAHNVSIGMVETADETVLDWVTETFERHQAEATPLTADRLAAIAEDAVAEA
jgi:predicted transcriptional regulator